MIRMFLAWSIIALGTFALGLLAFAPWILREGKKARP